MQPTPAAKEVVWGVPQDQVVTPQATHTELTHHLALTKTGSLVGPLASRA